MAKTIDKKIGRGAAAKDVYAALAYDSGDKNGGYQIKSVMHNTTYKEYFYDASQYIYSSASGTLDIVGATVAVTGNMTVSGTLTVTGSLTYGATAVPVATGYMGTLTVGIDDTGYDVKMYGATSGKYWLWDESADGVVLVGTFTETGNMAVTGTFTLTGAPTITGNTAITGTLGVTGDTTLTGALTVGSNGTGYDVKFYSENASYYWMWDDDADTNGGVVLVGTFTQTGAMAVTGNVTITGNPAITGDITLTGAISQTGNTAIVGTLTVGVDATGHDVKFYAETTGYYWLWDQNQDTNGGMTIVGTSQFTGAVTVGVNDTGHDVKLYGATDGSYLLWDESDNRLELDGADINLQDDDILQFGDGQDVTMTFNGTQLNVAAAADGAIYKFGNGTNDFDIWIYGGSNTVVFNEGDSIAYFDGYDINLKDADILEFGDDKDITIAFSGSAFAIAAAGSSESMTIGATDHVINTTLTGTFTVGVNDTGHDVKFFGATDGSYLLWDESDDRLEFVNAKMELGTSGSPTAVLYNGTQVLQIYTTCGSTTDTGFSQQIIKNVMTGAGQSTEGFGVELESNVKLGTYANAMCVRADWQTNGGVAGLGSVICAEMVMGAGAMDGTFGLLELEVNCPTGWTGTGPIAFLYMNTYGATAANFDDYGYFLNLTGVTSGAAHIWYDHQGTAPTNVEEWLRVKTPSGDRWLALYNAVV